MPMSQAASIVLPATAHSLPLRPATETVHDRWLGRDFSEGTLLGLAYDFEQATHYRTTPALYPALG